MTEGRGKAGKEKDTEMSEECTHDCSTCGKSCGDRKQKFDFSAKLNAASKVGKVIAVASGKAPRLEAACPCLAGI